MSDNASSVKDENVDVESIQPTKEEYVAKKAYEEVTRDMHKFKSKLRDVEAAKSEYEAKLKSIEEQKLMEEKRWEELYAKEKAEKEQLAQVREKDRQLYLRSTKLHALKQELGGKVKDIYLSHANLEGIEINDDGSLSSESVLRVANEFRQNFPEVIPQSSNATMTNTAAPTQFENNQAEKSISEMTFDEKQRYLTKLKNRS